MWPSSDVVVGIVNILTTIDVLSVGKAFSWLVQNCISGVSLFCEIQVCLQWLLEQLGRGRDKALGREEFSRALWEIHGNCLIAIETYRCQTKLTMIVIEVICQYVNIPWIVQLTSVSAASYCLIRSSKKMKKWIWVIWAGYVSKFQIPKSFEHGSF